MMEERKANTARITAELEADGYHAEDATVSIVMANVLACVTALPAAMAFLLVFFAVNRDLSVHETFVDSSLWLCLLLVISIPVHECLHGCGWVGFCQKKWKSIQFGVMWESLTPYCHCREALGVVQYYIGLLLPFTVLGLLPCILGLAFRSPLLMYLGAFNSFIAGGDTTIGWRIVKYLGKDAKILDHPDQCGAVAFQK